jgi:methionine synthase II (cobalamin-independent)
MERVEFNAKPTFVGSFPHKNVDYVLDRIAETAPEIPAWPQLPNRDFRESMYVQHTEGFPGSVLNLETQKFYFKIDDRFYEELESFYHAVVEENIDYFAIGADHALGLHRFLERLGALGAGRSDWLKGQLTGPFSFAMTVTDENKRSIAYNPELNEMAIQGTALKARWIAKAMNATGSNAIVVLDEPYLCSYGSAFVNVDREDVVAAFNTVIESIHREGALAGLHCCGNTDWSLPLETDLDILNFDAYEFFHGLPLYPDQLKAFLNQGGTLSFGIIPTSDIALSTSAEQLLAELTDRVDQLESKGMVRDQLYRQSLLTPACGVGSKSERVADRVIDLLAELAHLVREQGHL